MCMVEGEDNPELIEKILVMHGKQQQKQQEDLDDAADAEGWIDVCKETDAQHRKIMEKLQENEKIENTIQNYQVIAKLAKLVRNSEPKQG